MRDEVRVWLMGYRFSNRALRFEGGQVAGIWNKRNKVYDDRTEAGFVREGFNLRVIVSVKTKFSLARGGN